LLPAPKRGHLFIVADQSHSPTVPQHATSITERTFVSHEHFAFLPPHSPKRFCVRDHETEYGGRSYRNVP
jgi:hypothetical protein